MSTADPPPPLSPKAAFLRAAVIGTAARLGLPRYDERVWDRVGVAVDRDPTLPTQWAEQLGDLSEDDGGMTRAADLAAALVLAVVGDDAAYLRK